MGITVSMRGGDMNKKVYDPDGDGKFDTDEIHVAGAKGVASLAAFIDHDNSKHTDRRRKEFFSMKHCSDVLSADGCLMDVGHTFEAYLNVPEDYVIDSPLTSKIYVVWKRLGAAGAMIVDIHSYAAAHDEPYSTHTAHALNINLAVSAVGDIGIQDTTLDLVGITKNDLIKMSISGDATLSQQGYIIGAYLDYMSDE